MAKRTPLYAALAIDGMILIGSVALMGQRWAMQRPAAPPAAASFQTETSKETSSEPLAEKLPEPVIEKTAVTAIALKRNILFQYRNSKPKKVEVSGDFNEWALVPLKKGANATWSASVNIAPGEYTYNFLTDGVAVRDPNNPRTKDGKSLLVVKPAK